MPTILRFDGLRVVVYPNDHRPAHVHVFGGGNEAVFVLDVQARRVVLRECWGFGRTQLQQVADTLDQNFDDLVSGWRDIHGDL